MQNQPNPDTALSAELGLLLMLRDIADGRRLSLPRLRKACELPMSQLQRLLGRLESLELVRVETAVDGFGDVVLTDAALALLDHAGRSD